MSQTEWTLRLGGAAVMSSDGTQDKPAHTQERATVMAACYICFGGTIILIPSDRYWVTHWSTTE